MRLSEALGNVFQEVSGLGDDKHVEQCKPLVQMIGRPVV